MTGAGVVTVDGPAGSGKSTLGRALAAHLGLPLIDTGLFYRGIMVAAVRAGLDGRDPDALARLAAASAITIGTDPGAAEESVVVDGIPAGELLRDPHHAALLARVSGAPAVRAAVLEPQRALAAGGAVAVGRDCGTVVFPDATVKLYLDAPEPVRAGRRRAQLHARGSSAPEGILRAEVGDRDRSDTERAASPLRRAADAHLIDTSAMGIEAMIARAISIADAAGLHPPVAG